jgi:hypothetical protein
MMNNEWRKTKRSKHHLDHLEILSLCIYIYRNALFGPTKMGIIISDEQPFVDSTIDDLFGDSTDTSTRGYHGRPRIPQDGCWVLNMMEPSHPSLANTRIARQEDRVLRGHHAVLET